MMCGVPLYDERWVANRWQGMWLPRQEPITPPCSTNLTLLRKTVLENNNTTARFEFKLTGPSYMNLFIQAYEDDFVAVSNWTFSQTYLKNPPTSDLSYHIFITFGIDEPELDFFVELQVRNRVRSCHYNKYKHIQSHRNPMETLRYPYYNWAYRDIVYRRKAMSTVRTLPRASQLIQISSTGLHHINDISSKL